jgi:4-hydroxy-tetrahydrodipicolinate reductase
MRAFLGHASGVPVSGRRAHGSANAQVLIDFTGPEATMTHLKVCRELGSTS